MKLTLSDLLQPFALARLQQLAPMPQGAHVLVLHGGSMSTDTLNDALSPLSLQQFNAMHMPNGTIPLPAHQYDLILCTVPLHHHPEWKSVLAECARMLRHGGQIYLQTRHSRKFPRPDLRAELARLGFTILGSSPSLTNPFRRWLGKQISLIAARLTITQPEYD
jgi:2-polyprenyl-3-methyl-5-hydroxy-6-metoxy-1,4-benzoquinol methylase